MVLIFNAWESVRYGHISVKKIKNEWPNNNHFCAVMHGNGVETCNFEKNDSCRFNTAGLKNWMDEYTMYMEFMEWFFIILSGFFFSFSVYVVLKRINL